MTRKTVKGSIIADHLAYYAMEDYEPLDFDFPDEDVLVIRDDMRTSEWWTLYFDGAVNVLISSPNGKQYPFSVRLQFECTNNTT